MNLRPRRRELPDPNLTPLIDVVFLLLIFFMVSTTFNKEARITIELPEASTHDAQMDGDNALNVTVDAQGRYYVNQREVINTETRTLKRALRKAAGDKKDLPVIIMADAKAAHQSVIRVMDAASQLGFVHLTFSAKQPAAE